MQEDPHKPEPRSTLVPAPMDPVLLSFHAPTHDLDVVARHVVKEGLPLKLREWHRMTGASELVYLSTCQRAVWLLWGGDPARLGLGDGPLRMEGEAAWTYLMRLATGLESATLGDREILGQLKDALQQAHLVGVACEESRCALEDILREAQRLRVKVGLADGQASVATVALRHLEQALPAGAKVALVGVGPMTAYLADRLPERGYQVTLANRTRSRAEALAHARQLPVVALEALQADPGDFDALVTATASPTPLFTLDAWRNLQRRPLRLLDLALPVDSEPALEQLPWVHRIDLSAFLAETSSAKARRAQAAQEAEPWIMHAVGRLRTRAGHRARKYHLASARQRLNQSWDDLERHTLEKHANIFTPEQMEPIRHLLHRGRTLAHRALMQGIFPDEACPAGGHGHGHPGGHPHPKTQE